MCLFRGWNGRNLEGGAAIAHARPLRLLRDRFARSLRGLFADSISLQGQCNRCTNGRAQLDEWIEGARSRATPPAFDGWEMGRSQWEARVRGVVYYV